MTGQREDKYKLHRLIQIDKWIRSGGFPSVEKMAAVYDVSRRTILRDIEFLRDRYDAPVEYDKIRKGYYYTDPTFMIQNVLLTEGDLFTVSTIMPLLEQYKNTPLESSFKNIMSKIAELLPSQVSVNTSFLNKDVVFISDPLPKIEAEVFNQIFAAIKIRKVMEFEYRSVSSSEYKHKTFNPFRVLCQKGNWYVIGFDHDAADTRVYTLSRIKEPALLKETFAVPEDFDIAQSIDPSFGIWNNKDANQDYELCFVKQMANYITEREWHKNQIIEKNADGSVTLKFSTNQKEQVLSWVLSFGDAVTVIAPESLRTEVQSTLKRLSEKYKV